MTRTEYIKRKRRARKVTGIIGIAEAAGIFGLLYVASWLAGMV